MKFLAKNSFIITLVVVFIGSAILDKVFNIDNFLIRLIILMPFAMLLSPKKKKIQTEEGEKIQVKWLFKKEPIILD
ncbi:hypothetical protein H3Z83_06925 [Tenacibaculum sp. S7007]|uniref:Uncharacterized protein n=1 Tax=Tenacibaculum pelagium TaxID=2759527 RepID=A0A839AMC3_9FLAO|nr:hypothetical protein [Tenacibaculum pelagium]MBA6156252.1 hypothetical protein [Tenacibaculum pelagium]